MSTTHNDQALTNGAPPAEDTASQARSAYWQVTPELDVYENESGYLIQLDVPGANAESVRVEVLGAELRVRAEQAPCQDKKDVALAAFERRFELPSELDSSSASAELRDGVLQIHIQKSAAARRVRIPVNAN